MSTAMLTPPVPPLTKTHTAAVTKEFDSPSENNALGPKDVVHWISVDNVDRSKEVMVPDGILTENFDRGGRIVMFGHARGMPLEGDYALPVATNVWIRAARHPSGGMGLMARTQFHDDPPAQKVCSKVKKGQVRSWSVTFIPIESGPPTREEIRLRPDWAEAKTIYRKWDLVEFSIVCFPDNPLAVTISKHIAHKKAAEIESLERKQRRTVTALETIQNVKSALLSAQHAVESFLAPSPGTIANHTVDRAVMEHVHKTQRCLLQERHAAELAHLREQHVRKSQA
jgi:hypothetical protein